MASTDADRASAVTGRATRRPNTRASPIASAAVATAPTVMATVEPHSSRSTPVTGTPVATVQPETAERLWAE